MNSTVPGFNTGAGVKSDRKYFKINASISNDNVSSATFWFRMANVSYETSIGLQAGISTIRRVFPWDFSNRSDTGANEMGITVVANASGFGQAYTLLVDSVIVSGWAHYQEDYFGYFNATNGEWFNNPPFTKATDKNVFFPGNISDALGPIPAYGNYTHLYNEYKGQALDQLVPAGSASYLGIYDSLDPFVIEAQLRLMWHAGIDVVMFMHPSGFHVAETIMNIAWDIKERFESVGSSFGLKFAYYDGWYRMSDLLYQIKAYEHYADLYLRLNETRDGKTTWRPVFYTGYTGLLEEPYANYVDEFDAIRKAHPDVFMVGDGYLPPKEEMLYILDGFYFYDTSGLMRQGYGDPSILVYQPDATPSRGLGKLDVIFSATSSMVHGHGKLYAGTAIPGTDNTCVHDFIGSPLEDGRPGTIVERAGGFTFDYTWQSCVDAGADWITITSWNELHEGTEIEPTVENGTFYVDSCRMLSQAWKQP